MTKIKADFTKITGKIKPKEKYLEDRLYELMEKYLICQRQNYD